MGCHTPACPVCARNCLLIHGKNKDMSPVTSFFKVMITDKFSEVLFLPPKIARTMRNLINKETHLEDASGQRWTVTLSRCDGSLAFQQGWHSFSLEHALEVGDFMVFHYVLESHFVVQIFGKNGCERTHFSGKIGSRRKRTNTPAGPKDVKYNSIDSNSMNKQGQGTSPLSGSNMEIVTDNGLNIDNGSPKKMLNEELLCMIGMDARHMHEDRMNSLYDLLDLEMERPSDVDGTTRVLQHERSPCHSKRMPTPQAGADIVDKIPVTEKIVSMDVPSLEIPEANEDCQMTENVVLVSINDSGNGNTNGQEQMKKTKSTGEKRKEASTKQLQMKIKACGITEVVNGKYTESKECGQSFNHPVKDEDHVFKVIKTEPVDTFELASANSVTISFTVTETKPFVVFVLDTSKSQELPESLPCFSSKGRPVLERKAVVLLRDPVSRLWPVLYQEKSGMKALTSGWEGFVKANSVGPGDKCAFEVENKFECIYKVGIVPK